MNEKKYKKYNSVVTFHSKTICFKMNKKSELRLKEIIKQIDALSKEMNKLFEKAGGLYY